MKLTPSDVDDLQALRNLLVRMGQANLRPGGNGMTFPDEIGLLDRVINELVEAGVYG